MLSQPDGWEAPLAEVKNWAELKAWLETQPREVSVVFAARAALRVLPVLQQARGRDDFATGIVPPIFRAVGVAWVAAKYRTKPTNPAAATRIDAARAAAARAAAAVRTDAVIYVDAADAYAAAAVYVEASVYADPAVYATSDDAYAPYYAAAAAYHAAECAAAYYATAAYYDADDTRAVASFYLAAADASNAADAFSTAATFWSAVSADATRVEEGAAASDIAGWPLWPLGQPDQLGAMWQGLKAALHVAKSDWEVWTTWYDLRLAGCVRDEKCELTFVRIADALWEKKVPAKVNAEIRKRIEADTAKTKLLRRAYSWCREESTFAWKKFREGFYSEGGKSTYKHVVTVCFAVVVGIITFVVKYSDRLIDFILRK